MFGAFEAFCIWPINKPDETVAMLQDVGATPLDESAARPFLNSLPGRAWAMRTKDARLVIVASAECTVPVAGFPRAIGTPSSMGLHGRAAYPEKTDQRPRTDGPRDDGGDRVAATGA